MTREETIKELEFAKLTDDYMLHETADMAIEALKREPKTGHWIDNHNGTILCSHCGTWFYKDERYSYMHYCPYCNTKMAESEEVF